MPLSDTWKCGTFSYIQNKLHCHNKWHNFTHSLNSKCVPQDNRVHRTKACVPAVCACTSATTWGCAYSRYMPTCLRRLSYICSFSCWRKWAIARILLLLVRCFTLSEDTSAVTRGKHGIRSLGGCLQHCIFKQWWLELWKNISSLSLKSIMFYINSTIIRKFSVH